MFSNVGWGEILVIFILGLILIGPERLPKVIQDVRAMLLAARTAINEARESLSDEFGEDFDDLRKPLQELNEIRRLNPKTAITKTLFDGDDTYLDLLTGQPAAGGGAGARAAAGNAGVSGTVRGAGVAAAGSQPVPRAQPQQSYQQAQPVPPAQPQPIAPQSAAQPPVQSTPPIQPQATSAWPYQPGQSSAGVWHNPVEEARQQSQQLQQPQQIQPVQPAQSVQPAQPVQQPPQPQPPRGVSIWVDSDNL